MTANEEPTSTGLLHTSFFHLFEGVLFARHALPTRHGATWVDKNRGTHVFSSLCFWGGGDGTVKLINSTTESEW